MRDLVNECWALYIRAQFEADVLFKCKTSIGRLPQATDQEIVIMFAKCSHRSADM
jgi:hypothetical protein